MRRIALVSALVWLGLAAPAAARADELLLAAAVSLREPALEMARRFEAREPGMRVDVSLGASSALAQQVRAGAPVDVFVSADERLVASLVDAGAVRPEDAVTVAGNRLVVVGAPDRAPVRSAEALFGEDVHRVALAGPAVPVGHYAREWLASRGLAARLAGREVLAEHARAALAAVESGNADLAIVYATDARAARRARVVYEVPDAEQPAIRYVAALVADRSAAARRLFRFVTGEEAAGLLRAAGFTAPPLVPVPAPARGAAAP